MSNLREQLGRNVAGKLERLLANVSKTEAEVKKAHDHLVSRRKVANKANVAKATHVLRNALSRAKQAKRKLADMIGKPQIIEKPGYHSRAHFLLQDKLNLNIGGQRRSYAEYQRNNLNQMLQYNEKIKAWKSHKRVTSSVDFGTVSLNTSTLANGKATLDSVSIGFYRPITHRAPAPAQPAAKKEEMIKKAGRSSDRQAAMRVFSESKANEIGSKPKAARTSKADKKAAVRARKTKAMRQKVRRAWVAVGIEAVDTHPLFTLIKALSNKTEQMQPNARVVAVKGALVLLHHQRVDAVELGLIGGVFGIDFDKKDWQGAVAVIDAQLRELEREAQEDVDKLMRAKEERRLAEIAKKAEVRAARVPALKAGLMLQRERREARRRAEADYRPGAAYERGRRNLTLGSCAPVDSATARVLLDVAGKVSPGHAVIGIDRNAEDIYLFAIAHDNRALQFVLTAREAMNRIGSFKGKRRAAGKRGRDLPRRGNVVHMMPGVSAEAQTAMRLRIKNALHARKRRKLTDVVQRFIKGVVSYVSGRYDDRDTADPTPPCTIYCGNSKFKHNMRGGLTWIGADALLDICSSVTNTYSIDEAFSSQKCAFCTHFVLRKGDYKHAHCPHCNIDLPRDLMAAACMARIGLWRQTHGEREDDFTIKSTRTTTEQRHAPTVKTGKPRGNSNGTVPTAGKKRVRVESKKDDSVVQPLRTVLRRRLPNDIKSPAKRARSPDSTGNASPVPRRRVSTPASNAFGY